MLGTASLGSACSKTPPITTSPAGPPEAVRAEAELPAIAIPAAIPVEAGAVVVLRTSDSLYATFATLELLGPADPADVKSMRAEIDALLRSRVGTTLTSADRATGFFTPNEGMAVILHEVDGNTRGEPAGEVAGVPLHEVDGVTLAVHGGELVLGERAAVALALATATGGHASLRDSDRPLVDALVRHSEGAAVAAAVDVAALPAELRRQAEALGVEQAMLSHGSQGIRVAVYGPPEALMRLRELLERALGQLGTEIERRYEQAHQGDQVWSTLSAIVTHYRWKHAQAMLAPTLEGRRLGLHFPVQLDDPMVLVAFAGMAAAVAVPALTEYLRRAKTSEARVGVARLFDATAAFFYEERPRTGELLVGKGKPSTVHRCPSDGRLRGEVGPTPPLSLRCADGPGGKCVPVEGTPDGPGEYSIDLWRNDPVWRELGFEQNQPHAFHYAYEWVNVPLDHGSCLFEIKAFGDLDGDGAFSTFERKGVASEDGISGPSELFIDQESE